MRCCRGPYIDDVGLAQGRQSDAWLHVVGKRKEGGSKGQDAAVQGHARGNPGHRVLANTKMNIPPGVSGRTAYQALGRRRTLGRLEQGTLEVAVSLERGAGGRIEIARAADQVRYDIDQRGHGFLSGVAGRHRTVRRREAGESSVPSYRQFAGERLPERRGCRWIDGAQRV